MKIEIETVSQLLLAACLPDCPARRVRPRMAAALAKCEFFCGPTGAAHRWSQTSSLSPSRVARGPDGFVSASEVTRTLTRRRGPSPQTNPPEKLSRGAFGPIPTARSRTTPPRLASGERAVNLPAGPGEYTADWTDDLGQLETKVVYLLS